MTLFGITISPAALSVATFVLSALSLALHYFKAPAAVDDVVDSVLEKLKTPTPPGSA